MSPMFDPFHLLKMGFPRVSGDEPGATRWQIFSITFSPRERG